MAIMTAYELTLWISTNSWTCRRAGVRLRTLMRGRTVLTDQQTVGVTFAHADIKLSPKTIGSWPR